MIVVEITIIVVTTMKISGRAANLQFVDAFTI
jgi:hypothetical protein